MALRVLIVAQIACVTLIGAAFRGGLLPPAARGSAEAFAALAFLPVLLGFPLAVSFALRRAGLPPWKRCIVVGAEAALGFATLVAALPGVQ